MSTTKEITRPLRGLSRMGTTAEKGVKSFKSPLVELPRDMYLHSPYDKNSNPEGCPTEWWWHIGTLVANKGTVEERKFGFEINAAAFYPNGFTQVMLTDVANQKHYHQTQMDSGISLDWAEKDPSKAWKVELKNVSMKAPQADPTKNMVVTASIEDQGKKVSFDLNLSQDGKPLMIWGDGVQPDAPKDPKLNNCNFYFSLTRLMVNGTITIADTNGENAETFDVTGMTWMDHEWGKFGTKANPVKWILQDMQFDNGVCLSNYAITPPVLGNPTAGQATVQLTPDGESHLVATSMIPTEVTTIGEKQFFTKVTVEVPDYGIEVEVETLMPDQSFMETVYEGVAWASGTMILNGEKVGVQGTAWLEQAIS